MRYIYNHQRQDDRLKMVVTASGNIKWEIEYPFYTQHADTGELIDEPTLVDLGVMKGLNDAHGLEQYLKKAGVLDANDTVVLQAVATANRFEKGGEVPSILDSKYDLLGDEKQEFMEVVEYNRDLQVGDELMVKGKNGNPDFKANFRGYNESGNLVVWSNEKGLQYSISKNSGYKKITPGKPIRGYINAIEYALENGLYEEAIQEGRMSKSDAVAIIESAGLDVPQFADGGTTKDFMKHIDGVERGLTPESQLQDPDQYVVGLVQKFFETPMSVKEFRESGYFPEYTFRGSKLRHLNVRTRMSDVAKEIVPYKKPMVIKRSSNPIEILKGIVSDDDLRPAMTGIYFSKGVAAATDGHKLVVVKADTNYHNEIIDPSDISKPIDARYPQYRAVIPEVNFAVKDIDAVELIAKLNGMATANKIIDRSDETAVAIFVIDGEDIAFDPELVVQSLKALVMNGATTVHMSIVKEASGAVFCTNADNAFALVMPRFGGIEQAQTFYYHALEGTQLPFTSPFVDSVRNDVDLSKNANKKPTTEKADKEKKFTVIENDTPILTSIVADQVVRDFNESKKMNWDSNTQIDASLQLEQRAAQSYQNSDHFRKLVRASGNKGRDSMYTFMNHWLEALVKTNKIKSGVESKNQTPGIRLYQGEPYSDLEGFVPGKDAIGDLVKIDNKYSLYGKTNGERHKIGELEYQTPNKKARLKITESRSREGVPEFHIMAFEIIDEKQSRERLNSGSSTMISDGVVTAKGFDDLNAKIKENVAKINKVVGRPEKKGVKTVSDYPVGTEGMYKGGEAVIDSLSGLGNVYYYYLDEDGKRTGSRQIESVWEFDNYFRAFPTKLEAKKNEDPKPIKKSAKRAKSKLKKAIKSATPKAQRPAKNIALDKKTKALHPGKRKSQDGNTYYESRDNRSDVNRAKKL